MHELMPRDHRKKVESAGHRTTTVSRVLLWLLLCVAGLRLLATSPRPQSASFAGAATPTSAGGARPWAMPLRLRGGRDPTSPPSGHGAPPPFKPRSVWLPGEQEETAAAADEAWEDRQTELEDKMGPGIHACMSADEARERVEMSLEAKKESREQEEALYRQLAQHIQRLKEAHAQITAGTHPSPPETATGSTHRVRHRSRPPSESPGPPLVSGVGAVPNAQDSGSGDSHLNTQQQVEMQARKTSANWKVEGTEEIVLQHRQDVVRKVRSAVPPIAREEEGGGGVGESSPGVRRNVWGDADTGNVQQSSRDKSR